ncbi:hypothetical protein QCA50_006894 [Cerrena zonata]|uniref:Peptidase A2 domain-containing protein n=1 Tax=Cerrena zonata TaxID=2478898 RepID=A0AAW0GA39_9APHY
MPTLTQKKQRKATQGGTIPPQGGPATRSSTKKKDPVVVPVEPPGAEPRKLPNVDDDEDLYADPPETVGPHTDPELGDSGGSTTMPPGIKQESTSMSDKESEATHIRSDGMEPTPDPKLSPETARNAIRPDRLPLATRLGRIANRNTTNRVYAYIFNRLMTMQQDLDATNEFQNSAMQDVLDAMEQAEGPLGVDGNSAVCEDPSNNGPPALSEEVMAGILDPYATIMQGRAEYIPPPLTPGLGLNQGPLDGGMATHPSRPSHGPDRETRLRNANLPPIANGGSPQTAITARSEGQDKATPPHGRRDTPPPSRGHGGGGQGGGGDGPPGDGGDDYGTQDEDNNSEEGREWPPHLGENRGGNGAESRARAIKSPTPTGGTNPPHSYYYRQNTVQPSNVAGRHETPSIVGARDSTEIETIRCTIREKVGDPLPDQLPILKNLKISQPAGYSGQDDTDTFDVWLSNVCRWLRISRIVGPVLDIERVHLLGTVLEGEALLWYHSVIDGPHRIKRHWDFESAVVALYYRFIHQSTSLNATEKFEGVQYTRNGGARQLATDLGKYAGRMVQSPDDYTIKRRFWFALPKEMTRILGAIKGLSAERTPFDYLIEAAAEIEDAMRAERIGDRLRASQQGSSTGTSAAGNLTTSQGTAIHKAANFSKNRPVFQKPRVRFNDRPTDRGGDIRKPEATGKPSGATRPPLPRSTTSGTGDYKGKTPRRGCFNCGSMDHWANDPKCPEKDKKPRPAIRRIAEDQQGTVVEDGGTEVLDGQHTAQLLQIGYDKPESEEGDLEGSQFDPDEYPDEYPDEEYFSYSESEGNENGEWMGGMYTTTGSDTEWLGGMRLTYHREEERGDPIAGSSHSQPSTGTQDTSATVQSGDDHTEIEDSLEEVVFNLALPPQGYLDDIVLPQRVVQDYRGGWADRLARTLDDTDAQLFGSRQMSRMAVQEAELHCLRASNCALIDRLVQSQRELANDAQDNVQLIRANEIWIRQCSEMNTELRTLCNAINTGTPVDRLVRMVQDLERRQHQRALDRERVFSRITIEAEEDDDDMPSLIDEATFMAERMDRVHRAMGESGEQRLFAILANRDREYRSAMAPKEVRPQRDFKCITVYVVVNGLKGLALLDSGSSIDCVSPEFAKVAKLPTRPLDRPVGLQLGCVGSRSSINFGSRTEVLMGTNRQSVYLDVVNIDHYNLILGVPFLQQFAIKLDFRQETITTGTEVIKSLQVGEEVRTAKPLKRVYTGTSAKYQWAEKDQYE